MLRHVLLASALVALAACSGETVDPSPDNTPDAVPEAPKDRGFGNEPTVEELGGTRDTLVIAYQSDADVLNSVVHQTAADGMIINNINYTPTNPEFECELTYGPGVYGSWEWNEAQTEMTVKLRPGVMWSDGTPVTAADIDFTYELIADPVVASPRMAYIEHMEEGAPEVVDDHTVVFRFDHAYDRITMEAHAGFTPVPHHVLKDADRATLRGHEFSRNPIITGPWKVADWKPDERIVLEPNEEFTGDPKDAARIERVIFKILPEYATRLVELENGQVDLMQAILVQDADRLAVEHPEIKLYRRGWRSQDYVAWNQLDFEDYKAKKEARGTDPEWKWEDVKRHHIFGDKETRIALSKAVDVDKMMNDLLTSKVTGESYAKRSVSTITPALCSVHNNDIQPIAFDPEAAKADLAAVGWTDTDGDGVLDKDGKPFRFTLMTNSGNPRRAKGAIIMQAQLKDVGVDMQIETIEANTFFERLRKKDYEAALSGWSAGLFVDMTDIWHSGDKYEFNFTSYADPEVDDLIDRAIAEPDPVKNAALWKQAQARIYEDQPYTFLYWMDEIVGVHSRFKDAKVDVLSAFRNLRSWWVPTEEVKYKH
ncbi:MAG TPA: ABC transporter substrate-binding protein [Myxococcota bacterium]|nr:ABC transporter substrate-binding protein [Myxococcota bacterium]